MEKDREEVNNLGMSKSTLEEKAEYGTLTYPTPLESRYRGNTTQCNASALLAGMKTRNMKPHPSISRVREREFLINTQAKSLGEESGNTRDSHKSLICACMALTTLRTELVTIYPLFQKGFHR